MPVNHVNGNWDHPPESLSLDKNEIHIWRADLRSTVKSQRSYYRMLSEDEKSRSKRFHFEKDRNHFIVARGSLRKIISRYIHKAPGKIVFSTGPHGKPTLKGRFNNGLQFNLTHSHEKVLYAVCRNMKIGIDIEFIRPDRANIQIAERFFSKEEVDSLITLPKKLQTKTFYHCWTRKEAYIKARGNGLSYPLGQFSVSILPGEPVKLLKDNQNKKELSLWSLEEIKPGNGYIAALAVEGRNLRIQCLQWIG